MTDIRGRLTYCRATGPAPRVTSGGPGHPEVHHDFVPDVRTVDVRDARAAARDLGFAAAGFTLIRDEALCAAASAERDALYRAVEAVVRRHTGAARVIPFDPTRRTSRPAARHDLPEVRHPVHRVHGEFTRAAAEATLRDLTGSESASLGRQPFEIVQLWMPLSGTADGCPLVLADARTVAPEDVVAVKRVYPGWTGEMANVAASERHAWYWYPHMRPGEAILFRGYHARAGAAPGTIHTALERPDLTDPPERISLEIRAFALGLPPAR